MTNMSFYYNSQLVRYLLSVDYLHSANYGSEDAFELYHQIQEREQNAESAGSVIGLPALGHALAGSAGTAISHILLYPLDLVITRLQVQRQLRGPGEAPSAAGDAEDAEYKSLQDAAQKIYKNEGGLKAFWNGCATDTGKSVIDSFLFFLAYTALRQRQQRKVGSKSLPVLDELSVGIAAGAFSKFVTTPIAQIVTRKQTAALVAARDPTATITPGMADQLSIKDIALQIRSERGIKGFWAGYSASLILTLNPGLTFLLQNLLKRILLPSSKRDNPGPKTLFLLAAVSKAIASTVTYPFSLAKSRAQATSSSSSSSSASTSEKQTPDYLATPDLSPQTRTRRFLRQAYRLLFIQQISQLAVLRSLRTIYRTEGLAGLYSGVDADIIKGFLGHGLSMVLKERIHLLIISAYYMLLKATKRWPSDLGSIREQAAKEFGQLKTGAEGIATGAGERVSAVTESVRSGAGTFATDAGERVGNITETVRSGAGNLATGAGERMSSITQTVRSGAGSFASDAGERAGTFAESVRNGAGSFASDAGERVGNITQTVRSGAGSFVSDAGDRTGGIAESVKSGAGGIAETVRNGTGSFVSDAGERAGNITETVKEGVRNAVESGKKE